MGSPTTSLAFYSLLYVSKGSAKEKSVHYRSNPVRTENNEVVLLFCFVLFVSCSQVLRPDRHLLPACGEHGPTAGRLDVSEFPGNPHQKPFSLRNKCCAKSRHRPPQEKPSSIPIASLNAGPSWLPPFSHPPVANPPIPRAAPSCRLRCPSKLQTVWGWSLGSGLGR